MIPVGLVWNIKAQVAGVSDQWSISASAPACLRLAAAYRSHGRQISASAPGQTLYNSTALSSVVKFAAQITEPDAPALMTMLADSDEEIES